jgi:superkiller protein 3
MASLKAKLKSVNEFIKQSKFDEALKQAQAVLEIDPKSYQA